MFNLLRISLLSLAVAVVGCGPGSTPVEEEPGSSTEDLIRQDLQNAAETGQLGSEMMSIQNELEKLKQENPELAQELSEDLNELEGMQGSQAKSKAQSMIDKL